MNIVVTCLLTATPDPQRGEHLDNDVAVLAELRDSVHRNGRALVILHDELNVDDDIDTFVRVEPGGNPYFYRWRLIADWLIVSPDVVNVWCVDGTDVEMLHDPFPHMQPDAVYSGSENWQLGTSTPFQRWLDRHCPSRSDWYRQHRGLAFLNMGLLGGSRSDVLAAAEHLAASEADGDDWEIGAWQQISRSLFTDRLVTGEPVHTEFRKMDHDHPSAWWRHK